MIIKAQKVSTLFTNEKSKAHKREVTYPEYPKSGIAQHGI
jgi:hypothetical protein